MSKYGVDERGWPLVLVDPAAIPEGFESVRVGWPKAGELSVRAYGDTHCWRGDVNAFDPPRLIVRPIPKPIRLPLAIVPHDWWVVKDAHGDVHVLRTEPWQVVNDKCDGFYRLPPWIAAQLPQEWHDLPWDQSAMQQTEGGEG